MSLLLTAACQGCCLWNPLQEPLVDEVNYKGQEADSVKLVKSIVIQYAADISSLAGKWTLFKS